MGRASTRCPLSLPRKKAHRKVSVTLKAKLKKTIPREFTDYWWLFRTLHVSRYSAISSYRLVEEERRTILDFGRFRFATLK